MKKLLKTTITLAAIGVAVKVIRDRKKYFIEGQQLRKDVTLLQNMINQCDKL